MAGWIERARKFLKPKPVVSVLRLYGAIGVGGPLGRGLDDSGLAALIARAFAPRRLAAVALAINSPGGSPTQSALIAARIRRHAAEKKVPVLAFCEDVAASGGYWLACAADEIFADDNAIIGSIGVVSAGFGLTGAIARLGVERRLYTAGSRKSLLDPFSPENPEDVERLRHIQRGIHANFIAHVTRARGTRLAGEEATLFSGDIWLAGEAQKLGLIDGIGHLVPVIKARFGEDVRFAVARPPRTLLQRLGAPGAKAPFGEGGAQALIGAVEERAMRARFGL